MIYLDQYFYVSAVAINTISGLIPQKKPQNSTEKSNLPSSIKPQVLTELYGHPQYSWQLNQELSLPIWVLELAVGRINYLSSLIISLQWGSLSWHLPISLRLNESPIIVAFVLLISSVSPFRLDSTWLWLSLIVFGGKQISGSYLLQAAHVYWSNIMQLKGTR